MMNLFTYGTLMEPGIMCEVSGCVLQRIEGTLENFVRYGVRGEQYPGVIRKAGHRVDGILYLDVPAEAMKRLDSFEGEMYCREPVEVLRIDDRSALSAMVYVFKPEYTHLLTGNAWDYENFLQNGRVLFESEYSGFGALQRD